MWRQVDRLRINRAHSQFAYGDQRCSNHRNYGAGRIFEAGAEKLKRWQADMANKIALITGITGQDG